MYVVCSVLCENWSEQAAWFKSLREKDHPTIDETPDAAFLNAKGYMVILDWEHKKIMGWHKMDIPMGFDCTENEFIAATWKTGEIEFHASGKKFSHPFFNHVHTVEIHPNYRDSDYRLLVTSSGMDAVFELDEHGHIYWEWYVILFIDPTHIDTWHGGGQPSMGTPH